MPKIGLKKNKELKKDTKKGLKIIVKETFLLIFIMPKMKNIRKKQLNLKKKDKKMRWKTIWEKNFNRMLSWTNLMICFQEIFLEIFSETKICSEISLGIWKKNLKTIIKNLKNPIMHRQKALKWKPRKRLNLKLNNLNRLNRNLKPKRSNQSLKSPRLKQKKPKQNKKKQNLKWKIKKKNRILKN